MPKKITIVSAAALVLLLILIFTVSKIAAKKPAAAPLPKTVSVFFPEKNEILTLSYKKFLSGCIAGLLPNGSNPPPEALRAVAIAEHTRAVYTFENKDSSKNFGADFAAGEDFPYDPERDISSEITALISDLPMLTHSGELFYPQMCKISAGATDAAPPYSPSTALLCDMSAKGYDSSSALTPDMVRRALGFTSAPSDAAGWFSEACYADTGTLLSIEFCGKEFTGAQIREAFDLRSTAISVEYREDKFYFSCKGQGENRGMSVNAAIFFAKSGHCAEEILAVFYPDSEIRQ